MAGLVIAALANVFALLIAVPLVVAATIVPLHERRRDLRRTAVPVGVAMLLLLPWIGHLLWHAAGSPHPLSVSPAHLAEGLVKLPTSSGPAPAAVLLGVLLLGAAGAGFCLGWRDGGPTRTLSVLALTWLAAPPLAMTTWQAVTDRPGLVIRYWVFCAPAIAIGVGLAVGRLGRRHAVLAMVGLAVLSLVALPGQRAARGLDAHGGRQYLSLLEVMDLPPLQGAPVIIRMSQYRAVIANQPSAATRFPLEVGRPGHPLNLVHPHAKGIRTRSFAAMVREHPTLIAYDLRPRGAALPRGLTPRHFSWYDRHLRVYDVPEVLCRFYGELLGVFSQEPGRFSWVERQALADSIEGVDPRRIHCTP